MDFGAEIFRFAEQWGIPVREVSEAETLEPYSYLDSSVIRLSLNGLEEEDVAVLAEDLERSPGLEDKVRKPLAAAAHRRRLQHDGARYINVMEGTLDELAPPVPVDAQVPGPEQHWWNESLRGNTELLTGARTAGGRLLWWLARGYDVSINDAPVLRTTVSGTRAGVISPMPWTPGALAAELKREFTAVHGDILIGGTREERAEMASLPAGPLGTPKWASHSCRRGGTKRARDTRHLSGAEVEDIDRHFRWHTAEFMKNMQVSYAGMMSVAQRIAVTLCF
jgi:hypothetical protein